MLKFSDARRLGRSLTGICLIGAPVLFLIASIVQPDTDHKNKLRELNAIAAHKGTYLASGLLYLLAGIVLIAAAIGVIRLFRGPRGVTLGQISGALLVLGGTVSFGWYALGAAEYEMVNHTGLDRTALATYLHKADSPGSRFNGSKSKVPSHRKAGRRLRIACCAMISASTWSRSSTMLGSTAFTARAR